MREGMGPGMMGRVCVCMQIEMMEMSHKSMFPQPRHYTVKERDMVVKNTELSFRVRTLEEQNAELEKNKKELVSMQSTPAAYVLCTTSFSSVITALVLLFCVICLSISLSLSLSHIITYRKSELRRFRRSRNLSRSSLPSRATESTPSMPVCMTRRRW